MPILFGMFETILSGLTDEFPHLLRHRKTLITAVACSVEFFLGLPCITQGGMYVLQVMDWYCASFSLMLISLTECLVLSYVYGVDRLLKDIALMIGYDPPRIWYYMWKFITPACIIFIWMFSVITLSPVTYGEDYIYPQWAIAMGWMMGMISLIPIPVFAAYQIYHAKGSLIQRVKFLMKPHPSWGPAKSVDRQRYIKSLHGSELANIIAEDRNCSSLSSSPSRDIVRNIVRDETKESFLTKV